MNKLTKSLSLIFLGALLTNAAHADVSIRIGNNCAQFYYQSPTRWHNSKVNLNCVSVRRIKHAPRVDGITFFVANTFDRKYSKPGGRIVVAVSTDRADAFAQRYRTTVRGRNHRHRDVRHTPLKGVFRCIDNDIAYLDISGRNIDLTLAYRDNIRKAVIHGMDIGKRYCRCNSCRR